MDYELIPGLSSTYKDAPFETNRWGMRDRDYLKKKRPGTARIAALGVSIEMGAGVAEKDIYLSQIEDRLKSEEAIDPIEQVEILNFAVGGYGIYQHIQVLRDKVLSFEPDVLLFTGHTREAKRSMLNLGRFYLEQRSAVPERLLRIMERAGVTEKSDEYRIQWLLTQGDYFSRIQTWGYEEIIEICNKNGILPLWVFIPRTEGEDQEDIDRLKAQAAAAGFSVLSAEGAYGNRRAGELTIAPWDNHPNEIGHKLLADAIFPSLYGELQQVDWRQRWLTER